MTNDTKAPRMISRSRLSLLWENGRWAAWMVLAIGVVLPIAAWFFTQAIIAMAHGLKLRVIAEGTETREQLSFLRAHECDEMQGYYFSRPLPEHEFFLLVQNSFTVPCGAFVA